MQLLYNVVDRIYLGHLGNESSLALTGVGLTFPIITLIMAFAAHFGMGGVPLFGASEASYVYAATYLRIYLYRNAEGVFISPFHTPKVLYQVNVRSAEDIQGIEDLNVFCFLRIASVQRTDILLK